MDTTIFLPFSILCLYLVIFVAETLLKISRQTMQKHARALLTFPADHSQMRSSHRSRGHDDVILTKRCAPLADGVNLGVAKYTSKGDKEAVECAFCLCDVEEGDEIRELKCDHLFHRACLDKWLTRAMAPATCPLCRGALVPPETTPPTAKHLGDVVVVDDGDEENDDSLMILFSYVDANGWLSRVDERLRAVWTHGEAIDGA